MCLGDFQGVALLHVQISWLAVWWCLGRIDWPGTGDLGNSATWQRAAFWDHLHQDTPRRVAQSASEFWCPGALAASGAGNNKNKFKKNRLRAVLDKSGGCKIYGMYLGLQNSSLSALALQRHQHSKEQDTNMAGHDHRAC